MKLFKIIISGFFILSIYHVNAQGRDEGFLKDREKINNNQRANIGNRNNRLNVDKTNINVNVDNSHNRNTIVRNNNRTYNRPPYTFGGRRYYAYQPYHYHPFRPYSFGPMWHPWGFFITTLAVTAIVVTVNNQAYHYDNGVYYSASNGGYVAVQAPYGATIQTLPTNTQTVIVNETQNNYYYGGTFYEKSSKGYTVVPPTAGTIVENLPNGAKEEKIGSQTYMKLGDTYFQPIQQNGKDMYEVANVQ